MIIGIIIGVGAGAGGMYFLLTDFPILESIQSSTTSDSLERLPPVGFNEKEKPTITTNNLKYTVLEVLKSDIGVKGEKPLEGGIFILSKIEIENIGKTEITIFGNSWYVQDSEGRIFKPKTFDATKENSEKLFSIQIPPGFKIVRYVGFEIPAELEVPLQLYVPDKSNSGESILLGRII